MQEKLAWLKRHGENLRRTLMLEPRGHSGMHGALLTEPFSPSAHAGLLTMHAGGFSAVSGEAAIAAVKIGLDENLIHTSSDELQIDTPGGLLTVRPQRLGGEADQPISGGAVTGLPGFVLAAAVPVRFGPRTVPVDIAFGG